MLCPAAQGQARVQTLSTQLHQLATTEPHKVHSEGPGTDKYGQILQPVSFEASLTSKVGIVQHSSSTSSSTAQHSTSQHICAVIGPCACASFTLLTALLLLVAGDA